MKIFRIITELNFGGVERHMELTADGMLNYPNEDMIFMALGRGGQTSKVLSDMGFRVIVMNENPQIPNLKLIRKLVKLFKKEKPDVVHCSNGEGVFHGLWAAWLARVPVRIGEEVGFPNHHTYWKKIFNLTYKCSHKVIAISQAVKDKLIELGEASDDKIEVIYYPMGKPKLDLNADEQVQINPILNELNANRAALGFCFVTTCRLVAVKNLDGLIRTIAKLVESNPQRDIQMWIIGEGPDKEKLMGLAKALNVEKQIKFLGFQTNVNPFLMAADAFILPSFSEGFSLSLAEAMQLGLPSIATKVGGPSEIIKENTGYLIDPYSLEDMQEKMQLFLDMNKEERIALGDRGKQDVQRRFSVEKYIEELLAFYTKLHQN
ncbi:glycosyltransferase [Algoriphagus boritolerans]|uniref:Glycosyltransferase involved in cell wall bisynthesis n=1 Tax=Algoriphagus boritolerans DSM 17298 = JCM 18970 TaxID=1120964 RepID=A0A1H6A5H2_9BACT|nr:glycosyltransferase [Algoriphagus boritolerans]SEG43989.1 Glycosyltransferase involved in cell wall bisynthesis [Algoriphagus boritolerans DSM 17298 = JCM 18970]